MAQTLTDQGALNLSKVEPLLDQIDDPIGRITADGAYCGAPTYQTIAEHGEGIEVVIPPRSMADPGGEPGGRHGVIAGDDRKTRPPGLPDCGRSLAEMTMRRYESLLGPRARDPADQSCHRPGGANPDVGGWERPDSIPRQPIIA